MIHITLGDDIDEMEWVPSVGMPNIGTPLRTTNASMLSVGTCKAGTPSTGTTSIGTYMPIGTPRLDAHTCRPNLNILCDVIQKAVQNNGGLQAKPVEELKRVSLFPE